MVSCSIRSAAVSLFLSLSLLLTGQAAAETPAPFLGHAVTNFSLASSQNRLLTYGPEFYGKSNLIITFFPAAFTPV